MYILRRHLKIIIVNQVKIKEKINRLKDNMPFKDKFVPNIPKLIFLK
jgi:hypothetical protein